MRITPFLAAAAAAATVLLVQPHPSPPRAVAAVADAPAPDPTDPAEHGAPQPAQPDPTPTETITLPEQPAPTDNPTPEPTHAPLTLTGCALTAPWGTDGDGWKYQADENCNHVANTCEDIPTNAYAEVVARGYGRADSYCLVVDGATLSPPPPDCVTQDADGWDDYNCDGQPDYYRPAA